MDHRDGVRRVIELGPFGLDSPVGRGGMGQVWSGTHRRLGYPVAVKFLTSTAFQRPSFREAFRNEARAVAALDHRNIVRVYDYGEADQRTEKATAGKIPTGTPWLAMELVRGGTLAPLAGRLNWAEVESVIQALLEALAHAHARGVIHRDLKPGNLLVVRAGDGGALQIKLTDFGLAQEVEASELPGGAPFAGGTPAYMSPEQFEGRWRDYGPWTDLYAAGCLFWSLIRGQPPFGATTSVEEKRRQHLHEPPPPLVAPYPVPTGLQGWLGRLLEKDPSKRFRRSADALAAFRRLGPPSDGPVEGPEKPSAVDTLVLEDVTRPEAPKETTTLSLDPEQVPGAGLALVAAADDAPPLPPGWRTPDDDDQGAAPSRTGLGLFGLRATPLVDRNPERDQLWAALTEVVTERRVRAVVLTGPGGSGKSRLAEWLVQRAHEVGAANVLRASHGPIPGPTHGLGPMLRSYLRCQNLERAEVHARVDAIFRRAGVNHVDEALALTEVIQPAGADTTGTIRFGSPTERYVTVRRLLQVLADERAVVIWLDDAHHALDALRFAMYLLDYPARGGLPVLLVLTASEEALVDRKDEATLLAELLEHDRSHRIEVGPLPVEHRTALIRGILGLEPELARRVEDRTAGNPLFAVQLVGDWVQRGLLEAGPRGFRLRAGVTEDLPADVSAMWAARIERMLAHRTREEGHALELAAVLGTDVDPAEWGAVCLRAPAAHPSDALLQALLDQRLARCGPEGPGEGWSFAHAMVRESLEARAAEAGRLPIWHRACAELLGDEARRHGRVPGSLAERVGRHWLGGNMPAEAIPPLLEGARERLNTGDYAVADALLDLREEALDRLGVPESDERWGEGWLLRHELASKRGQYEQVDAWLERTEATADRHGWVRIRDRARCLRGRWDRVQGRYARAQAVLAEVEREAGKRGDRRVIAESRLEIAQALLESGDVAGAQRWSRLALQEYEAVADPLGIAECWQVMGEAAKETGQHGEASLWLRKAEGLFEQLGHRWRVAGALNSQGDVARAAGDLDLAAALYRRARGLLKAIGSKSWIFPEYNTGLVHLARGDYARAQGMLEVAMEVFTAQGNSAALANAHLALSICAAAEERWLLWEDHLGEAEGLLRATGFSDEDVARLATDAGATAARFQQLDRAARAWRLAAHLWGALRRTREKTDVERALARLQPFEDEETVD